MAWDLFVSYSGAQRDFVAPLARRLNEGHGLAVWLDQWRLSPGDARFWYYRALAERALGDNKAAEASRLEGQKAEKKSGVKADLAQALERVQGARRAWLREGK